MRATKLGIGDYWLDRDAAASFLRVVHDAGTHQGLAAAGRTKAQQQVLYDLWLAGKGNLAAKPGHSLHESGLAVDVTRKSPLQLWMVHGSDPMEVTATGTTRAAEYGWHRTVPSEAWHFSYDKATDKHIPKPTPTPTPASKATQARVGAFNCHGWAQPASGWTAAERKALIAAVKKMSCSIVCFTECPEYMRDAIRAALPGGAKRWLVATRGASYQQAILFDSSKWKFGGATGLVFGPTSYHGAVIATLTRAGTNAKLTLAAYHLPPNSVSSDAYQRGAMANLLAKMPASGARIVAGDGADESGWVAGWDDARTTAKSSPNRSAATYGTAIRDRIHSKSITVRGYQVIATPAAASDHHPVLAQITIPTVSTTA